MRFTLRLFCLLVVVVLALAGCRVADVFDGDESSAKGPTVQRTDDDTDPFRATAETTFEVVPPFPPPTVNLAIEGSGRSSPFGQFTFSGTSAIDAVTGEVAGINVITYHNGDELHWTNTGVSVQDPSGTAVVDGEFTIAGGTGRFENASGSGTIVITAELAAGTSEFEMDGVISGVDDDNDDDNGGGGE